MSYEVYLIEATDDHSWNVLESKNRIQEGGTQMVGGSKECHLNITVNYSDMYYKIFPDELGLHWLQSKTAKETEEVLTSAVKILGTERADNYWSKTMGNAGYALWILLGWAKEIPEGRWSVHN